MRLELHHCLLFILLIAVGHALVSATTPSRTRISINEDPIDTNCTRQDGVLVCPCNITVNGTYYPCWLPINNATAPNNTVNNTCFECVAGSFSNNNTGNCTSQCAAGFCIEPYECELCPVGYVSNSTGSTSCELCPIGYVAHVEGLANCTACAPGSTSTDARDDCIGCQPGYFSAHWGGVCEPCGLGTYSKGDNCIKCPKGTYNDEMAQTYNGCRGCGVGFYGAALGLTSKDQCLPCPAGSYCPDVNTGTPVTCPQNSYCVQGSSEPSNCAFLYTTPGGTESCKPGAGFYVIIFGSIAIAAITFLAVWRWRVAKKERLRRQYEQTEIDRLIPKPRGGPVYSGF